MRSPRDVLAILHEYLRPDEAEQERLVVALLNMRNVVIGIETLYVGNASGIPVRVAEVFRGAVRMNAIALIVAHNHPSGDPTPSSHDVAITAELADAARLLDVEFLDHVILGADGRSASMRALGHLGS
jgi:DNA repair protein RadC